MITPDLEWESAQNVRWVLGCDEVGRGAIAGPVAVVIGVLPRQNLGLPPLGLRDSKLLSAGLRLGLVPALLDWLWAWSLGYASAREIEARGISRALDLAAYRARAKLPRLSGSQILLLDGSHNWFRSCPWKLCLRTRADQSSALVAASSVLAKVYRDRLMRVLGEAYPEYGWGSNAGYGVSFHRKALIGRGLSPFHRRSWIRNF